MLEYGKQKNRNRLGFVVGGCIFGVSMLAACSSPHDKKLSPKQESKIREDVAATETIKMRVRSQFKDPESVEIRGVRLFRQGPAVGADTKAWSYTLCGEVNAKNSFGGYDGYHKFFYTALTDSNGKIREDGSWFATESDNAGNLFIKSYRDQCRDVVISASGKDSSSSNSAAQNSDVAATEKPSDIRADERHKSMPPSKWNDLVTSAIKQHCAIEGMTMEEVNKALGDPERVDKLDIGDSWKYSNTDPRFILFSPHGYMIGPPAGIKVPGEKASSCEIVSVPSETRKTETKASVKLAKLERGADAIIMDRNGWKIIESNENGERRTSLSLNSEEKGDNSAGLNIVCTNDKLSEIFIRTSVRKLAAYDGGTVEVQAKFGNSTIEKQRWVAKGVSILSENPHIVVKKLLEGSEFVVQFTTYQKQNHIVRFITNGLKENLEFISDVCRVK